MYYSRKTLCALLFTVAALFGCSQRDDMTVVDDDVVAEQNEATVVFRLQTNGLASVSTRSAEDSYTHVQGTADEYQVNNARVYLFDASTKLLVKSVALTKLTRSGSDANGNIVYEAEHVSVPQGTYDIFVTANTNHRQHHLRQGSD